MNQNLEEIFKRGLSLYPVTKDKKPLMKDPFSHATKDINVFKSYVRDDDYNAAALIRDGGLVVLDVDRHEGKQSGVEELAKLSKQGKKLPTDTYLETTPHDGLHYFFKFNYQDGIKYKNTINLLPGVEIKTNDIILYPENSVNTWDDIKPAPQWLVDEINKTIPSHQYSDNIQPLMDTALLERTDLDELEEAQATISNEEALRMIEHYTRTHLDYLQEENNFKNVLLFLVASYQSKEITYTVLKSAMTILANGNNDWARDNLVKMKAHLNSNLSNNISFNQFFGGAGAPLLKTEIAGNFTESDLLHNMLKKKDELLAFISDKTGKASYKLKFYQVASILNEYLPIFITEKTDTAFVYVYDFKRGIYTPQLYFLDHWARMIEPSLKRNDVNEVVAWLRSKAVVKEPLKSKTLIAVKNGFYDTEKQKLFNYSPQYFFTSQINTNYVENASEPEINNWRPSEWLASLADGDKEIELLLWQIISAGLNGNYSRRQAIFLLGNQQNKFSNGSNGKGTFQDLLRFIVGDENTANLKADEFAGRFNGFDLVNKTLDIGDDIAPDTYIPDSGRFNSAVTGDVIRAEPKGKQAQHYRFTGLIVQSANGMPNFANKTGGTYRRLVLVPFNAHFEGTGDNSKIKSDYIKRDEVREFFVNRAIKINFDKFTIPKVSKELLEKFKTENDTVKMFLEDVLIKSPQAKVLTKEWYGYYCKWSEDNGFKKPLTQPNFTSQLTQLLNTGGTVEKLTPRQWDEIAKAKDQREELIAKYTPLNRLVFDKKYIRVNNKYTLWTYPELNELGSNILIGKGQGFEFPLRTKLYDALTTFDGMPDQNNSLHPNQNKQLQRLLNGLVT